MCADHMESIGIAPGHAPHLVWDLPESDADGDEVDPARVREWHSLRNCQIDGLSGHDGAGSAYSCSSGSLPSYRQAHGRQQRRQPVDTRHSTSAELGGATNTNAGQGDNHIVWGGVENLSGGGSSQSAMSDGGLQLRGRFTCGWEERSAPLSDRDVASSSRSGSDGGLDDRARSTPWAPQHGEHPGSGDTLQCIQPHRATVESQGLGGVVSEEELQQVFSRIPLDKEGTLTSAGSVGHAEARCKPCLFHRHGPGCPNGVRCAFCHLEHTSRSTRRPCKAKRDRYRRLVVSQMETERQGQ